MAQRVFGPVRAAGIQVVEREGERPIEPGALGFAGYAGIFERGPVATLIQITSLAALEKRTGSLTADSLLPDVCRDYLELARGAGGLLLVRVTDGNEQQAQSYQLSDHIGNAANLFARRSLRTPIGKLKARNGGRWAGRRKRWTANVAVVGTDVGQTFLSTGIAAFRRDEWKGGLVELNAVANKTYRIIGSDGPNDPNPGRIFVELDSRMAADLAASGSPTDARYYLSLDNGAKALSFEIRDGEESPDSEFGIFVSVDGRLVNQWPDLSIVPGDKRYWVSVVNDDPSNDEIEVEDTFTGARTADVRPANIWGSISTATALVLTRVLHDTTVNSPTNANPTVAIGTTTDAMAEQVITCTVTGAGATFSAVSDRFGALGNGTIGALFTPNNRWSPPLTLTNGAPVLAIGDTVVISYKPFRPGALKGGFVYPDKVNAKRTRFRIAANTHNQITAVEGSNMTVVGAASDQFLVEAPSELEDGRDGVSELGDANFIQQAWDVDTSPFNRVEGRGLGLVKFGTPGNTATQVQKAGVAYAEARNHQYRYEIPANILTEDAADALVNDTLGRSDYAVVHFPSYADVLDPEGEGKLKSVSLTGMIHGREARIAVDNLGYHRAEAGIDATLPAIVRLPTGEVVLNEELLNPRGINVIKKKQGNFVLWGDRTLWRSAEWRFKHQREVMTFYEHVLQESFDFIVFALNNEEGRARVASSLRSFFLPEWRKGALDSDLPFEEAASIKIDKENNPPTVRAAGDMVVEIALKIVDVVERLRIFISKKGIFESVGG